MNKSKNTFKARLLNGDIIEYDWACTAKFYNGIPEQERRSNNRGVYIGEGYIYEINGIKQNGTYLTFFWKQ